MSQRYCFALLALVSLTSDACLADLLPADCPSDPATMTDMPLALRLGNQPGVPPGLSGYVFGTTQVAPNGTTCQAAEPPLPKDVLHGVPQPSLLHDGAGGAGILQGRGPRAALHGDDATTEEYP